MAVSVGQVEQLIERIAPRFWAEEWDNSGLLVGSSAQKTDKILLALDGTWEVVDEAVREKANLIVAHHPLMFKPLKNLRMDNQGALIPLSLFRSGISYYAAHTNLDQSSLSSSLFLSRILGLQKTDYLESRSEKLIKIVTFVPDNSVENVRLALAAEGVGSGITDGENSDKYSECFYQTSGEGMFKALEGANPAAGNIGELTRVPEIRLESIVPERYLGRAVKALHKAHPYEEPAYDLIPLMNTGQKRGYGIIGTLANPISLGELWEYFLGKLEEELAYDISGVRLAGDMSRKVRKIAVCNGSGSSFVQKAVFKGADLFITGDLDYHGVLDSLEAGTAVGELGHFLSEIPMMRLLGEYLREEKSMEGVEILISSANKSPWAKSG